VPKLLTTIMQSESIN